MDGQVCNRALKVLSTRNARGEFFCPGPIAAMDGGHSIASSARARNFGGTQGPAPSTALKNPHDPNRDPNEDPFYLFRTLSRFHTTKGSLPARQAERKR